MRKSATPEQKLKWAAYMRTWRKRQGPEFKKKAAQTEREWREKNPTKNKEYSLRWNYKLSLEDYNEMLRVQNHLCFLCGQPETKVHNKTKVIRSLHVDHNHTTGKVRKLLCSACNSALGYLKENTETMKNMIQYIKDEK